MLQSIYKCPRWSLGVEDYWLRSPIDKFLTHLISEDYSRISIRNNAYALLRFAAFVRERGSCRFADLPKWIDPFVEPYQNYYSRISLRSTISHFVGYLQQEGLVPASNAPKTAPPFSEILSEYETYLRECRGLHPTTITRIRSYCQRFLQHVNDSGIKNLKSLKKDVIHKFIISEGQKYARIKMIDNCSRLRRFLSYIYSTGRTKLDFSTVVISPKKYNHERCPRFLTKKEIKAVLSAVDRRSKLGKRDYALMLLLATYGLRGMEVTQLKLKDIDWHGDRIHIRNRKAGNTSVYPLAPSVGNAILSYLRVRPHNRYRQLFVTHTAPHKPVCTTTMVGIVKKYLRLVGLDTNGAGPYIFRYSCAQRLFEVDSSLKLIGDYLGHRDLYTTRRYVKIDINHLREVALNSGEELL